MLQSLIFEVSWVCVLIFKFLLVVCWTGCQVKWEIRHAVNIWQHIDSQIVLLCVYMCDVSCVLCFLCVCVLLFWVLCVYTAVYIANVYWHAYIDWISRCFGDQRCWSLNFWPTANSVFGWEDSRLRVYLTNKKCACQTIAAKKRCEGTMRRDATTHGFISRNSVCSTSLFVRATVCLCVCQSGRTTAVCVGRWGQIHAHCVFGTCAQMCDERRYVVRSLEMQQETHKNNKNTQRRESACTCHKSAVLTIIAPEDVLSCPCTAHLRQRCSSSSMCIIMFHVHFFAMVLVHQSSMVYVRKYHTFWDKKGI